MILIFGTSITYGMWDKKGGWAYRIKAAAYEKTINSNFQDTLLVYPLGISGNNSEKLLTRFDKEVEVRKRENEKMQIIIEIGINDSYYFNKEGKNSVPIGEYEKNLLQLIEKSRMCGAELVFVGLTPVDENVDPVPWGPEISFRMEFVKKYDDFLKRTCQKNNVSYIELLSKFENEQCELLADGLHPNTKGHEIIYVEVLNFLQKNKWI